MSSAGSLTILLVLEVALEYQVSAFTIGRTQETAVHSTDLADVESSLLEVKHDLPPNDVTVIQINNQALSQKIVPIETTAKTEGIQKNNAVDTTPTLEAKVVTESKIQETTDTSTVISNEGNTEIVSTSISNEISSNGTTEYLTDNPTTYVSRTTRDVSSATQDISTAIQDTVTDAHLDSSSVSSDSITNQNQDTTTDDDKNTSYSTELIQTGITIKVDTSSYKNIDKNSKSEKTTHVSETEIDNTDTTTNTAPQDTTFTETLTGDNTETARPYWKKYTVIERKRPTTTTEEDKMTSTDKEDMVRANTVQGTVTLEKAFSITSDIPSLESLKNQLLLITNKVPTTLDLSTLNPTEESFTTVDATKASNVTETLPTILSDTTSANSETTRLDNNVLTSQRAGFLNFSLKPTVSSVTTTIENILSTVKQTEPDKTTLFDIQDGIRSEKKSSSMASQTQLAEDAINEELMKEEMLNDNLAYTKKYREERFDIKNTNNDVSGANIDSTKTFQLDGIISSDVSVDDALSVKPISVDKQKNTSLYTVSPNYKPLKKIEIQAPKSFVRDPDDNSWRNESLSSLGIVFKAKNSSKPFTQVLKNKTETEWNAVLDKDNKAEEPELRVRLEKIAELRKTKKKKIDKFGETVYDYEESNNSAEFLSTPKSEVPELTVSFDEIVTTPSPTLPIIHQVMETTTEKLLDIITDDLKPITTQAPKKLGNLESEEGSEEDEIDYVSMSHIDLKKFMTSTRNVEHKTTTTQPLRHLIPERQPTVQYFPPRIAQKVNVNDYDNDFQRKVNAFTVKEPPKKVPMTYPPYNIEKDTYNQYNRQNTVRPTVVEFTRARPLNYNNYNAPIDHPNIGYAVVNPDGSFNGASYVIKHLKDYISEAAKDSDEDKNTGYVITEIPVRPITTNEFLKDNKVKSDYYDYESQFRKEVLDRFVENFNQNSERFKVDFPILYNSSVVHSKTPGNGKPQASSSAFIKRLYDVPQASKSSSYNAALVPYDPNCERTVELSPEYELHYYVPEQEEREEAEQRPATLPHRYRIRV